MDNPLIESGNKGIIMTPPLKLIMHIYTLEIFYP